MYALLQWLYDRAYRVYELIGTLYYTIRNTVLNAWAWVQEALSKAYNYAISRATIVYNNAVAWVNTYIRPIAERAYNWAVDAWNKVSALPGIVWSWIVEKALALWADVLVIRDYLLGRIAYWYDRAVGAAQAIVNGVAAIWNATVGQLKTELSQWITNVQNKIDLIKTDLGLTDPEKHSSFLTFISNPLGWFAAYLISILMTVLEYSVAYGLGSTTDTLPPWPSFGVGGEGGPYPTEPGPPPGAEGLAPPLISLWRSGYAFGAGHPGIDFGLSSRQSVFACHAGRVVVAGWSSVGYGYYVVIQGSEWWSLYAHLIETLVSVGQDVTASQPIGLGDTTGNSTGNHLHLELKHYGQYVDPGIVFGVG